MIRRPAYDPELEAGLRALGEQATNSITPEMIGMVRATLIDLEPVDELQAAGVEARDVTIGGYGGAGITVSVLQRIGRTGTGPGLVYMHSGGMCFCNRWTGLPGLLGWITAHNAVMVTVEYRLAPENPDPLPVEDCYCALRWTAESATELGIDPTRLVVVGGSAGGGLAAGTALLARERGGPAIRGQLLMYPMLDDRDRTVSTQQIENFSTWDRTSNRTGWGALLGDRYGTDDVSIFAAPARATDLRGLPATYIECGSADLFRDEDVAYASAIWAAGGDAELHIWRGGFHAYELFVPDAPVSRDTIAARSKWLARVLSS